MLKKSILSLLALVMAAQASAKIVGTEWGITAGVRYDNISFDKTTGALSMSPDITYNVGLHTSLVFVGFAIQPELNYGYTAIKVKTAADGGNDTNTKVKAHDLEVPLLFSLRLLPVVRFNVGPVFNIMSKANYEHKDEMLMFGPIHPSIGYAAGISLKVVKRLLIDVRYMGYFSRTVNELNINSKTPYTFRVKSNAGGIKIGFLF